MIKLATVFRSLSSIVFLFASIAGCGGHFGTEETNEFSNEVIEVELENPERIAGLSFDHHRDLYMSLHPQLENDRVSAMSASVPFNGTLDTSNLEPWRGTKLELFKVFQLMRDERIYEDPQVTGKLRRATWLHPYNGCFARAGHAARSFERRGYRRPGQVFAFGDLSVVSPYHPGGKIGWWFHVAAAYRVGDEAYVLDPSVDSLRPLRLDEWVGRLSKKPEKVNVSICDRNAYIPASPCVGGRKISDWGATKHLLDLLPDERNTLRQLGFEVDEILGDQPPWHSELLGALDWVLMLGDDHR